MIVKVQGSEQLSQQIYYEYDNASAPLGKGGMGTVYLGRCVSEINGAYVDVAIKRVDSDKDEIILRAAQEASVQIEHRNVIRMWGFIPNMEWDAYSQSHITRYYVVMEYLEGVNLDVVLGGSTQNKRGVEIAGAVNFLNEYHTDRASSVVALMKDVLMGVSELHNRGIVHRDIDPSNIMLTDDGDVKVIDFGISKFMSGLENPMLKKLTKSGTIMGKMDYAAPEVAQGFTDVHNYSTDVYSLGVMFYELLVGSVPFVGDSDYVRKCQVNEAIPVNNIDDKILRKIIEKATRKDQSGRYANADEMLADLNKWEQERKLGGGGNDEENPNPPKVPWWVYVVYILTAVLGLLASVGIYYGFLS